MALLRLADGDADGYRRACRDILARLDGTRGAGAAEGLVWARVLGPGGVPDPAPLRRRAEHLAARPANYSRLNTLGAVLYRCGDDEGAVRVLQDAVKAQGKGGTAWDMLFLAMAHQRLGRADEAKQWLERAAQWSEQAAAGTLKDLPVGPLTEDERLELRLLRDEAEALVRGAGGMDSGKRQ